MWQNIAGLGIVVAIISLVFGYFMVRLGKVEDMLAEKQDKTMCDQRNSELCRQMVRGEKSFDAIREKLDEQGRLLVQIDTTVKLILNGGQDKLPGVSGGIKKPN